MTKLISKSRVAGRPVFPSLVAGPLCLLAPGTTQAGVIVVESGAVSLAGSASISGATTLAAGHGPAPP